MFKGFIFFVLALTVSATCFAGGRPSLIREHIKDTAEREQRTEEDVTRELIERLRQSKKFSEKELARIGLGQQLTRRQEARIMRELRATDPSRTLGLSRSLIVAEASDAMGKAMQALKNVVETTQLTIAKDDAGKEFKVAVEVELPPSMHENKVLLGGANSVGLAMAATRVTAILKARGWEKNPKATAAVLESLLSIKVKYVFTNENPRIDVYQVDVLSRDHGLGRYLAMVKSDLDTGEVSLVKVEEFSQTAKAPN